MLLTGLVAAATVPAHATPYNYVFPDGGVGFALTSTGGPLNPGVLVGFNPQPDPPVFGKTIITLADPANPVLVSPGPCHDSVCTSTYNLEMSFQGIGNPVFSIPKPNSDGFTSFSFMTGAAGIGHQFDVTLHVTGPTSIESWVAFNPQPDPPADWFAFQVGFGTAGDPDLGFSVAEDGNPLQFQLAATPLPAGLPLLATGLGAMGLVSWRRRARRITPAANQ
jgi:hypothetical protein